MAPGNGASASGRASASEDDRPQDDEGESGDGPSPPAAGPKTGSGGRREVEVPPSLFRVVTVFSTLLAILLVVLGFTALGAATSVVSNPPGSLVVRLLSLLAPMDALVANGSLIALALAIGGLATIAAGAVVYVYGSRFRAPGMGKPKDASDEDPNDG